MRCLVCNSDTSYFTDTQMEVKTYLCTHCDMIFKDPAGHKDFETQKVRYDLHENHAEDEGYRRYFQQFLDFALAQSKMPVTALDFGCGRSTLLSDMLAKQGVTSEFYDPIYHPDTAYRVKKYDLITSVEVFEHLHDPMAVFEELVSLLSPDGILAIRTELLSAGKEAYLQWYYRRDPTHVVFFAPQTFRVMCEKIGVRYVEGNGKNMVLISKE